jgi:CHAT domain-containing protein
MLQYSLSEDRLVIFMLTRNEFKIITDTIGRQFFFDIEAYRKFLSHFSYNELDDTITRKFTALSNRLYNRLIQPFERNLTGKSLLIIPDDVLTEVPFEALITSPTTEVSYRNLPYLLRKHNINYSYSATLYAMNRHKAHIVNPRLLAVAPDYTPMKLMRLSKKNNPTVPNDSLSLSPIPGTFDEVKNISHIFNGKTLIKNRATEQRFKAVASQYDILHLAMHGITNNEYPMLSRLVFTPAKDSVNEGFLNTYEIYNMQLNAPLVVLSACNTGYGKLHKGEGIISLARGFYTAGAKSIVMALWPVEDKTSSELMANFYSNLASSQCISDALQNAKITYIDHADEISAHPYFWAGYILTGNPSVTYEIRKPKTKYYLLGAIGLLAIIVFVLGKRRIFLKKDEKDLFHFPQ